MSERDSEKKYWSVRQVYLVSAAMALVSALIIMLLTWHFDLDPSLYSGGLFNFIYQLLMACYWFCVSGFIYAMSGLAIRSLLGKVEPKPSVEPLEEVNEDVNNEPDSKLETK